MKKNFNINNFGHNTSDVSSMVYKISNQRFIISVCCFGRETWNANSWCKYTYADRNQPRLSRKWQREGKGRRNQGRWFEFSLHASGSFRCNRPVFRATRADGFSFDDIHATCDSRHVHTCISFFLKSIRPPVGGYLPTIVRLLRVPFLTSSVVLSYPCLFSFSFDFWTEFYGKKKSERDRM